MSVFNHSFGDGTMAETPGDIHPRMDGLRLLNLQRYKCDFPWMEK